MKKYGVLLIITSTTINQWLSLFNGIVYLLSIILLLVALVSWMWQGQASGNASLPGDVETYIHDWKTLPRALPRCPLRLMTSKLQSGGYFCEFTGGS